MEHFRLVESDLDVATIIDAIEPEMWRQLTFRQDTPGSPHVDSEAIFLRMPPTISFHSIFNELFAVHYPNFEPFRRPIEELPLRNLARVMLVKLKPGGIITPHIDEGAYADATDRYHLAVTTNPEATLTSGDETLHMPAGSLWFFDKHSLHCGFNGGNEDRIHLIVDTYR